MAPTIKGSPELNNKAGVSPRPNPVCLEVRVTIRSVPGESGGLSQPIREEGRTVIVFDNGAVLRSASNLPAGQKVILSNQNGREVVCRVAPGHNLPGVKGYVEVEFLEPAADFWNIRQDTPPVSSAAPQVISSVSLPLQAPPPPAPIRSTPSLDPPMKPSSVSLGSGPDYDDIPGLITTSTPVVARDPKPEPTKSAPDKLSSGASDYSHSQLTDPTSLAGFDSPSAGLRADVHSIPMIGGEASHLPHRSPAPARDFLSKGIMAYEKPRSSSGESEGRAPLLLGLAALILAGVGAVVFVMHRNAVSAPVAKKTVVSQPSATPPAASTPATGEPSLEAAARAAGDAAAHTQPAAEPAAMEQALPLSAVAPVPAVYTSPSSTEARPEARIDSRNAKRPEKTVAAVKQPDPAAARRASLPNLKMAAPSAPGQNVGNSGEASGPVTEIAATEPAELVPAANLLTSAGRTSNPPPVPSAFPSANPPAPAAAPSVPKVMRDARLISSTPPVYPTAARQSSIQGTVTVSASIDATGKVVDAKALNGPVMLRQAAVDSVKQWKYSPAVADGKPAPSQVTVSVGFRLN